MESIDNNQFEVKPSLKSKRKIAAPSSNVFLNPALDLLANEDPMCNNAMEIVPIKKRRRTKSCDIATFENSALDLGISKAAVNAFLARELENVRKNLRNNEPLAGPSENLFASNTQTSELEHNNINRESAEAIYENIPIPNTTNVSFSETCDTLSILRDKEPQYDDVAELDSGISVLEHKSINGYINNIDHGMDISAINNTTNIHTNVSNQIFINNKSNLSLSFIDRLAIDSPNLSNQSLYLDDDLNESNIMEIKTITIITKKKKVPQKKCTNPFLNPEINNINTEENHDNPFLSVPVMQKELEYNVHNRPSQLLETQSNVLMPRRLFTCENNSTISTVNDSSINIEEHDYENIDSYRSESPIYENIDAINNAQMNKQSKILGCNVSQFTAADILNLNKYSKNVNSSNDSNDSKKDGKHNLLKASSKLSRKVIKTLKKKFKSDKSNVSNDTDVTLNPYEVPRKLPKQKEVVKESGIENPALNLDNSDEIQEEDEFDSEEHHYESVKTLKNTELNMNITPLRERIDDNIDFSLSRTTPGKKVRFDSTLNKEKIITGNSFDCGVQSPGFDAKLDKYHDELENCINEKKFLRQNM